MRLKMISAMAAALLLAACASDEAATTGDASSGGGTTNNSGITQTVTPGSPQDFQQNVGDRVFFAYDRSELEDMGRSTLQKQAAWLQRFPTVVLTIEGHADERGTREYNLALGARRAQAVRDYLVSLGVSGARIETISFGKERPICVQSDDQCWQQNRRGVSTIKSGSVS
jgi:peptidoglycan-associated lipoprotein